MAALLPYHRNFSTYILLLNQKGNSSHFSDNGIIVCAVKYNPAGEIWMLDRRTNTGAVFSADKTLKCGIRTDGVAVCFPKPEDMTGEERARYTGMFPKKL